MPPTAVADHAVDTGAETLTGGRLKRILAVSRNEEPFCLHTAMASPT